MNLNEISKAIKEEGKIRTGRKILIFGSPKTGKSLQAATIAKAPNIKSVYYFDLENSIDSVIEGMQSPELQELGLALTPEEAAKIELIPIRDTADYPLAAETILKSFTATVDKPVNLCTKHGKVNCKQTDCTDQRLKFSLQLLTEEDVVILDSGSQLADSILAMEMLAADYKDLRKYYGAFTIEMNAIMSAIQAAKCTVIMVTHTLDIMSKPDDPKESPKLLEISPLLGSQNYSRNKAGKYFGYTLMTDLRNGKYLVGSSSAFKRKTNLGNRMGVKIEDYPNFNVSWLVQDRSAWPKAAKPSGPAIKLR